MSAAHRPVPLRGRGAVALAVLAGLTACGSPAPVVPAPVDAAPPGPALSAQLVQHRADVVRRVVQVQTTASADGGRVRVRQVELRAPGFAPGPPATVDAVLAPGLPVDLPVVLGSAVCGTGRPGGDPALAVVQVADRDATVELPLPGADVLLGRLHDAECREQAVRAALDVQVLPGWTDVATPDGAAVEVVVRLARRPGASGEARVDELGDNILLSVRPVPDRPAPVLVLAPGQASADLRVRLGVQRCDGHALAESKRTAVLRLQVTGGGQERQLLLTALDAATALRVERLVGQTCLPPA